MNAKVHIGGNSAVSMTDEQLKALNEILRGAPRMDTYNEDKVLPDERIRLEAVVVVKTSHYKV